MRTTHADRIWPAAGALAAALLFALAWFLVISPQTDEAANLQEQANAANTKEVALEHRLADLQRQSADLSGYQARRDADRRALPTSQELAAFMRDLQATQESTAVSVHSVAVSEPAEVTAAGATMYALPLSITATGSVAGIESFLTAMQQVQPRAALIENADLAPGEGAGSLAGEVSITLNMKVFVASAGGASAGSRDGS
jgi:Tfp pilus assembly protein PilO